MFFHVQDAASAHLDSPGHRLRHFSMAARMLHVFNSSRLASLANLTRHRRSSWWPWPSGLVVQVRVVKSGTSILSRSDWPLVSGVSRFQYCVPRQLQYDCKCGLRCTKQPSSWGHEWLVRPAWPRQPIGRSHGSCDLDKSSIGFFLVGLLAA